MTRFLAKFFYKDIAREEVMNKKKSIAVLLILLLWIPSVLAYYEKYPPYKFNQAPYKHLDIQPLVDKDRPSFIVKNYDEFLYPQVYRFDIDGNGLEDFIVLLQLGVNTLLRGTDIYLKKPGGGCQKISYEGSANGIEDFVDINRDGKCEVIITDIFSGKEHNYFTFSVYEFKNYRLVNVDTKFKGFPKFVWMTNKPNDKDTTHLAKQERAGHVEEKNRSIKYEIIK